MTSNDVDLDQRAVATVRGLAMDAVSAANSGHTGTAMSLAPLAHVLYTRIMNYSAADPEWADRDRFVLSAGHASMLQYAYLYLTGHGLELDDIRAFRQWQSRTPGHPEVGHTAGVEVTTGPLGQGFANAVGMAMAERWLRARFGADVTDHYTFCIASDGDLMEGISHEAASFAGHQGLGRLITIYDDNKVTIDGYTDLALGDDAAARFAAYGWHVETLDDSADDLDAIEAAIRGCMAVEDRPSIVVFRTVIGHPLVDSSNIPAAHGAITDGDEIARTKAAIGLPPDKTFFVDDDVLAHCRAAGRRGDDARAAWMQRLAAWDGDRAAFDAALAGNPLGGAVDALPTFDVGASIATRKASNEVLSALVPGVPGLIAGSADLTGNTGVKIGGTTMTAATPEGRAVHYGIREHAMAAAMNGMALHGGVLPVGGTFLVFSDYCRPSIRLAALSHAKVIYSFTHDSVGVGEDGPTHQPVEHVTALRTIPGLRVIRPADANEVSHAWATAIDFDGPTALILTRQNVPVLAGTGEGLSRGGYVLGDADPPDVVLVGTGSEVQLCVAAAEELAADGITARVVSMPCRELFFEQDEDYQRSVIPAAARIVSVEAGVTLGWAGWADASVGIDRFGASAPAETLMDELGFTSAAVVTAARSLL